MQHRPVFREIDLFAGEHLVAPRLDLRLPRQVEQQFHRLAGNPILRIVEQNFPEAQREFIEPARVVLKHLPHVLLGDLLVMKGQLLVGRGLGEGAHPIKV